MFRKAACTILGASMLGSYMLNTNKMNSTERHAICILYPNNSNVRGIISFSQDSLVTPIKIACTLKGLNPNSKHGIHIHEFGDLTDGCATAGAHFNPHNKKHGGPFDQERHLGDLGNVDSDPFGNAYYCFKDDKISLFGQFSILGRSVVVHANEDDLGRKGNQQSLKTGNSGPRVACGVIGLSKQFKTVSPTEK